MESITKTQELDVDILYKILKGQKKESLATRIAIFKLISNNSELLNDAPQLLKILNELTNNGRNIKGIERDITNFVDNILEYVIKFLNDGKLDSLILGLNFLSCIIKFNFSNLNDKDILTILNLLNDVIAMQEFNSDIGKCILDVMDVILRYGFIPDSCLELYLKIICQTFNVDGLDSKVLDMVKNLFRSHSAYKTFDILCNFITNFGIVPEDNILIGLAAVDIISALFYSKEPYKLTTFTLHNTVVFKAFSTVSDKQNQFMQKRILNTLFNIVEYQLKELEYLEWDMILDIIVNLQKNIMSKYDDNLKWKNKIKDKEEEDLFIRFNEFLTLAFSLLESDQFHGDSVRLLDTFKASFQYFPPDINLKILNYCNGKNFFLPCSTNWVVDLSQMMTIFLESKDLNLKCALLNILERSFNDAKEFYIDELLDVIILPLISSIPTLEDRKLLLSIFNLTLGAISNCDYKQHIRIFKSIMNITMTDSTDNSQLDHFYIVLPDMENENDFKLVPTTILLTYIFLWNLKYSNQENIIYYFNSCIHIASTTKCIISRAIIMSSLSSLRADSNLIIYLDCPLPNQGYIAAILNYYLLNLPLPNNNACNPIFAPLEPQANVMDDSINDNVEHSGISKTDLSLKKKSTIFTLIPDDDKTSSSKTQLPINLYLNMINEALEFEGEWKIFNLLVNNLTKQIMDQPLFISCQNELNQLRQNLCTWITNNKLAESIRHLPDNYKRGDIYAIAYKLLNSLISYKSHFSKSGRDEMVLAYLVGLRKWTQTSRLCIHSLTICCYELPLSMSKLLPSILIKLSQMISTATISAHILEFLVCLARCPNLYSNFVDDEFKRVFGIALQYIHYNSSNLQKPNNSNIKSNPTSPSTRTSIIPAQNNEEVHMKYVLILAYQVITIWFVNMKLNDRVKFVPFIVRGLYKANLQRGSPDELIDSCLDMLASCSFSISAENSHPLVDKLFQNAKNLISKKWFLNDILIAIEASQDLPWIKVTVRRASGIINWLCEVQEDWFINGELIDDILHVLIAKYGSNEQGFFDQIVINAAMEPSRQITRNSSYISVVNKEQCNQEATYESTKILKDRGVLIAPINANTHFDPAFLYLNFKEENKNIIPVPNDPGLIRSIGVLDRMPIVEFHKIGVLYVGPQQTNEVDILSNEIGSLKYNEFIEQLGDIEILKGNHGKYLGGLDTESNLDGYYTLTWFSSLSKVVFHIASLMPTQSDRDPKCSFKKRHIGNDYVTIVYNDSNLPYKFDTLPGQFNLINLILTPLPKTKDIQQYFKIEAQVRSDLPLFSPVLDAKIVAEDKAPLLIRQLALNASIFAQLFLKGETYSSNYMVRLAQLRLLRDRLK